jgi:choline dehydrogenase
LRSTGLPGSLVEAERPRHLLDLLLRRRGPLTSNVAEALALVCSDEGLAAPDLELLFGPVPYLDHGLTTPPGHGYSIAVVLLDPESHGTVRLDPADPEGAPLIDPRYLGDGAGDDLRRLRAGIRRATAVLDSPAFDRYAATPLEPARPLTSDADLDGFIRQQAETLYHPVGTCRIGPDPTTSVVDPELRVHGVEGLWVADASVMPRIIRGHTVAPTLMVAERAAAMIRSTSSDGARRARLTR